MLVKCKNGVFVGEVSASFVGEFRFQGAERPVEIRLTTHLTSLI